jgi:hypothetical protein
MGLLTGTPLCTFRSLMPGRWEEGAVSGVTPRPMGVTAASWCGPVPGVTRARPPAVAVFGLRRSGRTGNGESPYGRIAPACQPGPLSSHPILVHSGAPRTTGAARRGALRAPLKT